MAYLSPTFKNDIFISYAHVDDFKPLGVKNVPGWVELFIDHLEQALEVRFGRKGKIAVWYDKRKLGGNTLFDEEIRNNIDESAIFIALYSRGYAAEEGYCMKELNRFYEKVGDEVYGPSIGTHSRVFNMLLHNIHYDEWPKPLQGSSGIKFYESSPRDPLGVRPRHDSDAFTQQLNELVIDIEAALLSFKSKVEVTPDKKPAATDAKPAVQYSVFLGHAEGTLISDRKLLWEQLRGRGVRLREKSIPPPFDADGHEEEVIKEVKAADLSVHLLNGAPGLPIQEHAEEGMTYYRAQVELGMSHAKSQMIWVPDKVDIEAVSDQGQKEFLQKLEQGKRAQGGYRFVHEPLHRLADEIVSQLERAREEAAVAHVVNRSARALLDAHQDDKKYASSISPVLLRRPMDLLINPSEASPLAQMGMLPKLLKRVSVLIIVFGSVASEWVQNRLKTAVEIAINNKCDLKLCGVYIAPLNGGGERQVELDDVLAPFPVCLFHSLDTLSELLDDFVPSN